MFQSKRKLQSIRNIRSYFKDLLDDENIQRSDKETKMYCEQEDNICKNEGNVKTCSKNLENVSGHDENDDI